MLSLSSLILQEGLDLLGGAELEKTRGQTDAAAQKSPLSKIKRTTTIAQTTQVKRLYSGSSLFKLLVCSHKGET